MKKATLIYLIRSNLDNTEVCLGAKKKGHGLGKWNGFGGKVEEGETHEECAVREVKEEAQVDIELITLNQVATIIYYEPEGDWDTRVYLVYYNGKEPVETDEMFPKWFPIDELPLANMWPNDTMWLPRLLSGEKLEISFTHDSEGKMLKHNIQKM